MPTLSFDSIRETPLCVLIDPLPPRPTPLLLRVAALAAAYLRRSEYVLMVAARTGSYTPVGWEPCIDHPAVHEESEWLHLSATERLKEYRARYELICGGPMVL